MTKGFLLKILCVCAVPVFAAFPGVPGAAAGDGCGIFPIQTEVGNTAFPGACAFDEATGAYRITGSGENMWSVVDAFHYLCKRTSGDLVMDCFVEWPGAGRNAHRKAGWMVRAGLDAASPYVDAVVHGDGLVSMQFRRTRGGETAEVRSPLAAPLTLRLERTGGVFSLSVSKPGGPFLPVGSFLSDLPDTVFAGLAVCSHDNSVTETAVCMNVRLEEKPAMAPDARKVESTLEIFDLATGERRIVTRLLRHFEAPNWSKDGKTLLVNSDGRLYTIPVEGGDLKLLDTGSADRCNNDHGYSFDGKWLAVSHSPEDRSLIYVLPAEGGAPRLVTPQGPSYWHGWSPDGKTLAYCAARNGEFDVYSIPVTGGDEKRLTTAPGLDDGPEYTPDGLWIYFNSVRTGLMKIWRMRPDGSGQEQVTADSVNGDWFAHPSPDGKWIVFLSYDASVTGHPANRNVRIRLQAIAGGEPKVLATLFGGQGTINVPSWAPDSRRFAFVSYRLR
jgi:TolB protein